MNNKKGGFILYSPFEVLQQEGSFFEPLAIEIKMNYIIDDCKNPNCTSIDYKKINVKDRPVIADPKILKDYILQLSNL
jgi:hypothetical protein